MRKDSRKSREPRWQSAPLVRGKLTCKAKGELGELAFVHKAASLGFGVAKPHGENEPYDFILDSGKRLWRVQVKSIFSLFRDGYRTSWQTSLGAVPAGIIVANMKKWSGDHCASDPSDTQGIFFSNRPFPASPSILDVSPTVLSLLGVAPPEKLDGHALSPQ